MIALLASAIALPDPNAVRGAAKDIVAGDEFKEHKGFIDRFFEWIADHLSFRVGGGSGPGIVGNLITLALIALAIVLIVRLVSSRRRPAAVSRDVDDIHVEVERRWSADDWAAEAERLEREDRNRDAVRARYRELVARLVDDGVVIDLSGRTTGETRIELIAARPAAATAFSAATDLFERVWYGGRPARREQVVEIKQLAASVLDATREPVLAR